MEECLTDIHKILNDNNCADSVIKQVTVLPIPTTDFTFTFQSGDSCGVPQVVDFVNNSKISSESIRENINNNILEKLLTQLISTTLIDIEINELQFFVSDEILANKIKKQESFLDEKNNFSRTKYEKFLLENNMHSVKFEQGIRDNELKKKLFAYIGGGIKSPFFLINKNLKVLKLLQIK